MSYRTVFKLTGAAVLLLCLTACSRQQLGLPRIAVEALSPNGAYRAWVKNHLSFDPPAQSLWIRDLGTNEATRVLLLAEDQDWCNTIVWAADGSAVVYLIQDARAVVYAPGSGDVLADAWLVTNDGAYPPTLQARDLAFGEDSRTLVFKECPRHRGECSDWITLSLPIDPRS